MAIPTPKTAIARAVERLVIVAVAAAGSDWLLHTSANSGAKVGGTYFVIKTVVDLLNSNIPNY